MKKSCFSVADAQSEADLGHRHAPWQVFIDSCEAFSECNCEYEALVFLFLISWLDDCTQSSVGESWSRHTFCFHGMLRSKLPWTCADKVLLFLMTL